MGQTQLFAQVSFVSVSLSAFISFFGGALREEPLALRTLRGEDPKEMMRAILYSHTHEQMYSDYQPSHTHFVFFGPCSCRCM